MGSWSAGFVFGGDQRISSAWNATWVQSGASVTLTGPAWNRDLPAGATVTAGLIGSRTGADAPPASATLNGLTCTTA